MCSSPESVTLSFLYLSMLYRIRYNFRASSALCRTKCFLLVGRRSQSLLIIQFLDGCAFAERTLMATKKRRTATSGSLRNCHNPPYLLTCFSLFLLSAFAVHRSSETDRCPVLQERSPAFLSLPDDTPHKVPSSQ